ncbi:hypothetical protein DAD66_05585 [Streptococcus agalactiae]|nr:LPXTG cell wall anchor domain-containing protein [Streptococcus agalactiae]MCC9713820.1 LPXTG cell wall anchor domain-containing protein [Streptococcus agalactiae]MCC9747338.1 LPXTG cell wall anchor domain-containing protein [Streptococcus agalactiae]TQB91654.1 hypothetical protein DAD74_00355 [Streptococcus agalactiae]TQC00596.1 hypothetical protein DAD71_00165 [Streptococcus agalactiae]
MSHKLKRRYKQPNKLWHNEDPKPSTPAPQTPVQGASVATRPETGEATSSSLLASALGVMTLVLAGLGLRKKKEEN